MQCRNKRIRYRGGDVSIFAALFISCRCFERTPIDSSLRSNHISEGWASQRYSAYLRSFFQWSIVNTIWKDPCELWDLSPLSIGICSIYCESILAISRKQTTQIWGLGLGSHLSFSCRKYAEGDTKQFSGLWRTIGSHICSSESLPLANIVEDISLNIGKLARSRRKLGATSNLITWTRERSQKYLLWENMQRWLCLLARVEWTFQAWIEVPSDVHHANPKATLSSIWKSRGWRLKIVRVLESHDVWGSRTRRR